MNLDLQLFAEGGTEGAVTPEGAAQGGGLQESSIPENVPHLQPKYHRNERKRAAISEQQGAQQQQPQTQESFEELINGRYKGAFQQRVQGILQDRLKGHRANEEKLSEIQPILDTLAAKYGTDPGDIKAIAEHLTDDNSIYEEEALQRGVDVETLKTMKKLESENARMRKQQSAQQADREMQMHIKRISEQATALQKEFPGFDLLRELNAPDERFKRMTSPQGGMSVRQAYFALHGDEIMQMQRKNAAQTARANAVSAVQAGQLRPSENGLSPAQGSGIQFDARNMTRKQRADIRRRVENGEKITF